MTLAQIKAGLQRPIGTKAYERAISHVWSLAQKNWDYEWLKAMHVDQSELLASMGRVLPDEKGLDNQASNTRLPQYLHKYIGTGRQIPKDTPWRLKEKLLMRGPIKPEHWQAVWGIPDMPADYTGPSR